jgi:hypothetical protein
LAQEIVMRVLAAGRAIVGVLLLTFAGCGNEIAEEESKLTTVTVSVKAQGRPVELDSIAFYTPAGEGVGSELPSSGVVSTRLPPGTYKVIAIPSSVSPGASKVVTEKYQDPAQTPWEVSVTESGGSFDLEVK